LEGRQIQASRNTANGQEKHSMGDIYQRKSQEVCHVRAFHKCGKLFLPTVFERRFSPEARNCKTCTALNDAQQHRRTATEKKCGIFLRTLHHNAYLFQKEHLYSRHEKARQSPRDIADLHVDGMTRPHSMFPCVGQDYTFTKPFGHKVKD
jgi:hypothetical protein